MWYYELSSDFFDFSVQTCIAKVWKREEISSANENGLLPSFSISHMLFLNRKLNRLMTPNVKTPPPSKKTPDNY